MKRKLIILLILWICFLLQTTVFSMIDFLAAAPNLMLILTVSIGFMQGRTEGMLTGFLCGLLIDLFYGDVFGFYALLYLLTGYFCGRYSKVPIAWCGLSAIRHQHEQGLWKLRLSI